MIEISGDQVIIILLVLCCFAKNVLVNFIKYKFEK